MVAEKIKKIFSKKTKMVAQACFQPSLCELPWYFSAPPTFFLRHIIYFVIN
jgi:hypothetical protein